MDGLAGRRFIAGGISAFPVAVLGLFEPVAVAVQFQDVDVVSETVEQRPVSRSEPKTDVHSSNGRLEVTMVEPRS